MKKLLIALFILISGVSYSQKKDTAKAKVDTIKIDSVKTYAIILTDKEYNFLIAMIKSADEKPSIIKDYILFINSKTQLLISETNKKTKN